MRQKRICAIFMLITLLLSCIGSFIPIQVEAKKKTSNAANKVDYIFIAGAGSGSSSGTSSNSSDNGKSVELPSEYKPYKDKIKPIYTAFTTLGFSLEAAAGICGNIYGESSFDTEAEEGGGTGIGLFQWSHELRDKVQTYFSKGEHKNHTHKSLKGFSVCIDAACQVEYEIGRIDEGVGKYWAKYYKEDVASLGTLKKGASDGKIPAEIATPSGSEEYKKVDKVFDATIIWMLDMERPSDSSCFWNGNSSRDTSDSRQNGFITNVTNRNKCSQAIYEWMGGTSGEMSDDAKNSGDKELANNLAEGLAKAGYFNETELEAYTKLNEININEEWLKDATNNNLTGGELGSVTNWRKNKDAMQEESKLIKTMRISLQVLGIFLAIWSVLIYIAYWLDRLNSFIEIDFVSLLTLDKLMISEDESDCTFKVRNLGKAGKKTINHQAVIAISVIGVSFATLLFTGLLFRFVALLVIKILELFGQ